MQIKKAGAVAVGALATVAAMGAPAAAATHAQNAGFDKSQAMRAMGAQFLGGGTARWGGWDAPWDIDPQATLSTGSGSITNANAFQACGSSATNAVGISLATSSPNTLLGDCANGNSDITQNPNFPVTGVLNDSVTAVLTNQACGSTASFAVGIATALQSPNTVIGDCTNGNVRIGVPHNDDWDGRYLRSSWNHATESTTLEVGNAAVVRKGHIAAAQPAPVRAAWAGHNAASAMRGGWAGVQGGGWSAPWDVEPFGLASAQSGSALLTGTNQACGATGVFAVGGAVSTSSPNTVLGDCDNANVWITKLGPKAATSVSDNSVISALPWQSCGSTSSAGAGGAVSLQSPNTVFGNCSNANVTID